MPPTQQNPTRLTRSTVERFQRGTTFTEQLDRSELNQTPQPSGGERPQPPPSWVVRVTGTVEPNGLYPAVVREFDIGSGTAAWQDAPGEEPCYAFHVKGDALASGDIGPGFFVHDHPTNGRSIFATFPVANAEGGGVQTRNKGEADWHSTAKLQAETDTGFEIVQGEAGEIGSPPGYDRAKLRAATTTQTGAVTTQPQTVAGSKGFQDGVAVGRHAAEYLLGGNVIALTSTKPGIRMDAYTDSLSGNGTGFTELVDAGGAADVSGVNARSYAQVYTWILTTDDTNGQAEIHTRLHTNPRQADAQRPYAGMYQDVKSGSVDAIGSSVLSCAVNLNVQTGDTTLFTITGASLFSRPLTPGRSEGKLVAEAGIDTCLEFTESLGVRFTRTTKWEPIWASATGLQRKPFESPEADVVAGQCRRFGVRRGTPNGNMMVMGIDVDMPDGARPIVRGGLVVGYITSGGDHVYPDTGWWASSTSCMPVTVPPGSPPVPPAPTPPAADNITLTGQVDTGDPFYMPAGGREVTLSGANTITATTTADGNYRFSGLSAGSTTVTIELEDNELGAHLEYDETPAWAPDGEAVLTLEAGRGYAVDFRCQVTGGEVWVTVVDGDGDPIAGRNVTVDGQTLATDVGGFVSFAVLAGANESVLSGSGEDVEWEATRQGGGAGPWSGTGYTSSFTLGPGKVVEVEYTASPMPPPPAMSGHVYDADGTTPLSGKVVTLSGSNTGTATTNGSGFYSFSGPLTASLTVAALTNPSGDVWEYNLNGGGWVQSDNTMLTPSGSDVLDFRFVEAAPPPPALAGHVYAEDGTTPLAGYVITLTDGNTGTATTNGSGFYSFASVANSSTTVLIGISGGQSSAYRLNGGTLEPNSFVTFTPDGSDTLDWLVSGSP